MLMTEGCVCQATMATLYFVNSSRAKAVRLIWCVYREYKDGGVVVESSLSLAVKTFASRRSHSRSVFVSHLGVGLC
jgi:hypothetical protein